MITQIQRQHNGNWCLITIEASRLPQDLDFEIDVLDAVDLVTGEPVVVRDVKLDASDVDHIWDGLR